MTSKGLVPGTIEYLWRCREGCGYEEWSTEDGSRHVLSHRFRWLGASVPGVPDADNHAMMLTGEKRMDWPPDPNVDQLLDR